MDFDACGLFARSGGVIIEARIPVVRADFDAIFSSAQKR
jgi:hypothetical protein